MFYFAVESKTSKSIKKSCGATFFDEVWVSMRNFNVMVDSFSPQTYFEDDQFVVNTLFDSFYSDLRLFMR